MKFKEKKKYKLSQFTVRSVFCGVEGGGYDVKSGFKQ